MKWVILLAAVVLASADPELVSSLNLGIDPASGHADVLQEFLTSPSSPLPSNLAPETLADAQDQYHAAQGIPEAAHIKSVEQSPAARIAGGLPSYVGEHPFFGGLIITLQTGQLSVCGSSLVTSTRLLTAAHCWHDGRDTAYSILAVLGSVRLFSGGTRVFASAVIAHAQYAPGDPTNDIALLVIPAVALSGFVKPIAIATGPATHVGLTAEAIGFGRTADSAPITETASLRDVFVTVMPNEVCRSYYGDIVNAAILCTSGAGGKNSCGGDTGGPLILYSSAGNDVLIGIINFYSSAGCTSGLPGGHVRVSYHANWIINNV